MDYFLDFLSKKVSDCRHVATFGVPSKSCEDSGILRESPGEFIVAQMVPPGSVGFLGNTTVTTVTLACAEGMNRHSQGTAFSFPGMWIRIQTHDSNFHQHRSLSKYE